MPTHGHTKTEVKIQSIISPDVEVENVRAGMEEWVFSGKVSINTQGKVTLNA